MTKPKITVIIPTRERLPVLKYSLQTVLSQTYENLEIIVSDNCSSDGTGDFVRAIDDPRVRYINTGRRVSMSENWEFALSHVEGGWVMFIGDDDGLLPGSIEKLAGIIENTDCEAITFRGCNYIWPGASGSEVGRLIVSFSRGREIRDSSRWLNNVLDARADYTSLPMIYVLGVVNVALIGRIRAKSNRFFNSCIPDIYASIALARSTPKYLYINETFSIIGCSKFSNGASFQGSGDKMEGGGEFQRFISEDNIPFHPDIAIRRNGGYPLSLQMIVYESYLQSKFLQPNIAGPPIERQLALALAHPYSPSRYDALNQEWGKEFARQHGIAFDVVRAQSKSVRRAAKFRGWVRTMRLAHEAIVIYDRSLNLPNVFVASIFASSMLWNCPSLLFKVRRAMRRLAGRVRITRPWGLSNRP